MARGARVTVLGLTGVHLAALAADARPLAAMTKPLLVPGLAVAFLASADAAPLGSAAGRLPDDASSRWLLAALATSTVGDVALMLPAPSAWLTGTASFLVAQGCYVRALAGIGALESLRRRPWPAFAYGSAWWLANRALGDHLGELRRPVQVYSAALCAMGATSTAVGGRVAVGGTVFVVSDLLIAIGLTGVDTRALHLAVMGSYVAAQYLLTSGVRSALRSGLATVGVRGMGASRSPAVTT